MASVYTAVHVCISVYTCAWHCNVVTYSSCLYDVQLVVLIGACVMCCGVHV